MNDIISQENNEFFTLFHLWEYFQENRDHTRILSDESRISVGNDCGQACDQPSTSTGGILETTELAPNETYIYCQSVWDHTNQFFEQPHKWRLSWLL
jgi:hypothetical protein